MTTQEIMDHLRSAYPTWGEMAELQQLTDADREDWRQRAERAEAALAERDTPCVWTCADADYEIWDTACGETYQMLLSPSEHKINFCQNCAHPVEVQP